MNNKDDQIELINIDVVNSAFLHIRDSISKATKHGTFDLDEIIKISVSLNNLAKSIDTLKNCQNYLIKQINDKEKQSLYNKNTSENKELHIEND
jgi:hypothetical protein